MDSDDSRMVSGKPPQRSVSTRVRPSTLPYISTMKATSTTGPQRGEPGFPERARATGDQHGQHQHGGHQRTPLLLERVASEDDDPVFFGDHAPAGALPFDGAAGLQIGRPDRLQHGPVEKLRHHPEQQRAEHDGAGRRLPVGKQVAAQPSQHPLGVSAGRGAAGWVGMRWCSWWRSQRSLMATRALYQFIAPDVSSEMVRYTAIRMAMHSTARPVWFMAVLAIETMSG